MQAPSSFETVSRRPASSRAASADEIRCVCGSLLARVVGFNIARYGVSSAQRQMAEPQIELKCRRCKRTTLVPLLTSKASD